MTCREKLAMEHPEITDAQCYAQDGVYCPSDFGYLHNPNSNGGCFKTTCMACWNREIPETEKENKMIYAHIGPFGDPSNAVGKIGEAAVKMGHSIDLVGPPMEDTLLNGERPHIRDSGNRTVFESGAVRDIQEGKGRCDLLPLDVVAGFLCEDKKPDQILSAIYLFQLDGDHRSLYSALDRFSERYFDDDKTLVLETAIHYEEGAKKYDENNWKKGIPVKRYIDSGVRHYLKFLRGDTDERHGRAFCWNMMGAIWTCKHMPELNEYRKVEEG